MFENLGIGTRLIAAFMVGALIAATLGFIGIKNIRHMSSSADKMYDNMLVPLGEISATATKFQQARLIMREAMEATDPRQQQALIEERTQLRASINQWADSFEKKIYNEETKKLFAEFKEANKAYGDCIKKVLELDKSGDKAAAAAYFYSSDTKKAAKDLQNAIDRMIEAKQKQAQVSTAADRADAAANTRYMLAMIVASVLLSIGLGLYIARSITRPLSRVVDAANRIAGGDLTVSIAASSRDETGQLMAAMGNMVEELRAMVERIAAISSSLASDSSQLHSASTQIATGAEEVAAQAETVATASEEMSATSNDIARSCGMAAEASRQSTEAASDGAAIVHETINGMHVIAERVRDTSRTIEALGGRSEQIGAIIGTIEDIADQTNLLALNAAIEAARAGEQGRGFAVVADEVRALAERTTTATREIGEMIKAIQNETREAIKAMDEGVREVEKGASSSERSGAALQDILDRIGVVSMQVSQIATAAEEQTATTNEATVNVQQITVVIGQTARGAEETAGAASALSGDARDLETLVRHFKLA
ncbi:methyl-accepting chemotaxis protein [Oryzomonas japonica]|uniref:Methyl-accepting chemotaxis protein n=1 Tax=Oryzomonas japonica TaxID=2603858 RepID=A0A7J4ZNZ9_9BACT|nr:methyl-accepting chemotaxis protein [Oryzomonas japonica]KAB0664074.1 methyl-accepting chemotaxis protein [Oryzomonas japonica]